jgi:tRNA1Val (adenine37-N6)-methyltransferase
MTTTVGWQSGGIVRAARRPYGWVSRGSLPDGPGDREDLWPGAGEDLCYLSGEWRIFQRLDGHRWSLDDLATAWFAIEHAPARVERALDLGCGIGSVLMMVAWSLPQARVTGVEAQSISVGLARRSLAYNGAAGRCEVIFGDLRDPEILADQPGYDLITGTPPYLPIGAGTASSRPQRGPCCFETRGGIEAYCAAAARVLAPGGRFVACEGGNPPARTLAAAAAAGLRVLAWREVIPREGKPPLFGLYAFARADEGEAKDPPAAGPPLLIRDAAGRRTPECALMREAMGVPP